ncbi:MAG: hypothetical protein FWC58_05315 [Desulfobulbus sp.]|nr:hypothetical protein [Desulfobulbus sp.]
MLDNLAQLHNAIIAGLRVKLPGAVYIGAYPVIERRITLPSVVVELDEMEPGTDPGTSETALIGRFQARAIVDPNVKQADLQVRELAALIAVAITHETWGLPIGVAKLTQIGPDGFKPELDGYLVWVVEWTHEFHLGKVEWPWPDEAREILLGMYPETGTGREDQYWPLGEAPPENWGESR